MSTGQGFGYSLFGNSITSNDVTAINNYANALKNGAGVGQAWTDTMKGTSVAAKQYVLDARKAGKSTAELTQGLNNMTLGAKASTVAMKTLGVAKNVALNVGTMLLISGVMKVIGKISEEIDDFIHRAEIAREKSTELTRAWNEENTSIGSSISKYKELKESLDSGTLSTQEIANAKNELAEIQDTLTSKYGQEALGIDLVNGKYDEQIKKLDELSRKKAEDYTAENYANIQEDIKYVNNSVKVDEELGSGAVFNPDTYNKYLKKYLDEYDALTTRVTDRNGIVGSSGLNIVGEGTREEIYNQLTSLFNDLSRDFGEDNPDVNKLKTALSGIISDSFDTEKMEQAKSNIKQYAEAQILSQNNTRQLYEDAINAVDNYNKALASGQGVEEAKANLDEVKQKVADNTSGISGAGQVFEDVWGGISEGAKTTSENLDKMTVSLSDMEKASDKISKLSSAFKELSDDGYITTKTLGELQTATGLSGDEWAEYENRLLNAKKGSADFNQVLSELTYKILENEFATIDLTNATDEEITAIENKIAATLRENGVENANAVAHEYVRMARVNAAIAAYDGTQASYDSAAALISESLSAEQAKVAMNQLELAKINVNNAKITSSDDIDNIIAIANAALASEQTLKDLARAKAELAEGFVGPVSPSTRQIMDGSYDFDFDKLDPSDFKVGAPRYAGGGSGGGGKGSSGSDKNKPDYEDPTDAIINRINLRAKELEQQEESIENALEIAELENDYEKQISLTNDLIAKRKDRLTELETANAGLHNEAEWLRNSTPQWNEEEWFDSQGNATKAYIDFINDRIKSGADKEEVDAIKDQFEAISKYKKAYMDNSEEIAGINKEILQDEEKIWDLRREEFDARMEESEYYIQHSKDFGWENGDNEIAARKRVLDWIQSDYYKSLIKDDVEYYKLLEEHRLNYIEAQKEEFNKANDFASSYIDSQKTLLQSYFDVTNSIVEAQHEINKELETSKTMYEWLDEDTRKLLFNQEDYNILSEELYDIQYKADKLRRQYERDLENSTLNTIEEITSNYEMQYDMLMKSYEIAKADLEVAKKKQKLNNVLNERNVRMFINGQWQWVADTQDVIDAQSELADAEYARKTAIAGERQTESLNDLTKQQDELGTVINKFEDGVITLDEAMDDVADIFGRLPDYVEDAFTKIQGTSSKSSTSKTSYSYNGLTYDPNFDYHAAMNKVAVGSKEWNDLNRKRNAKILGEGLPSSMMFASGTRYTPSGNILMGEKEPETFINANGHLIPINQPTLGDFGAGGIVFNQEQMSNLRSLWDLSNMSFNHPLPTVSERGQTTNTVDNRIIINGMTVDSGSSDGQALISALRRYVGNH